MQCTSSHPVRGGSPLPLGCRQRCRVDTDSPWDFYFLSFGCAPRRGVAGPWGGSVWKVSEPPPYCLPQQERLVRSHQPHTEFWGRPASASTWDFPGREVCGPGRAVWQVGCALCFRPVPFMGGGL